jgi:hypothetical protein
MQEEERRLKAEIEQLLAQSEAEDAGDDQRYGPDRQGDELPEELRHREGRLKKIQAAKAALEAKARQEAAQAGRPEAEQAEPEPKAQRNFTDPDSRIMLDSQKAFVQAYNAQLAVDAAHQIIVAEDVLQAASDKGQLVPMMEAVCDNVDEVPEAVSADAGFWVEQDIERLEWYEIPAFVAPEKIRHREWREAQPPTAPCAPEATTKDRMRHKLRTPEGRAEYDKRKVTVEPVAGQLKDVIGMRHFLLRGLANVRREWRLACTVHNLLKLWRAVRAAGVHPAEALAGTRGRAVPAAA